MGDGGKLCCAVNMPPGWTCDGRATDDAATFWCWGHKIAGAEPSSYTWIAASGNWSICFEAFASSVALDQQNCVDQYATIKASATSTTLAGARPFEQLAGDLLVYFAASSGTPAVTFSAGVTLLQQFNGSASGWEVQAAAAQTTARTVTFTPTETNRVEMTMAYAALPPAAATTHTVSGTGQVSIVSPVAIGLSLTGIPASLGVAKGNPARYFELGNIAFGGTSGFLRNYYLTHSAELIMAPAQGFTLLDYSLAAGVTAVITEYLVVT